ncbi:Alpha/Beta hydrolase protein [Aspergillus tetrazonus]
MASTRRTQWPTKTALLASVLQIASAPAAALASPASSLHWTPCPSNSALDCTTLTVPLEYADPHNGQLATIPLARYAARVPASQRKGTLLTNPGGPGSSGVDFLSNGAGSGISNITGGYYDIVSWDPRGVGAAKPLLACWETAGREADASASVTAAAEIEYSLFTNKSYTARGGEYETAIREYDASLAKIAADCAKYDSSALYISSAAYVVRDMVAIVDALDGTNASVNYWGFSYGTIYGAEFIQTFPQRVGRFVFDGVFNPKANAERYTSQLPNDQLYVADAIADLASLCEAAGEEACALASAGGGADARGSARNSSIDIAERLANLQASLYENPVSVSDGSWSITVGMFSFFMYSFLKLPTAWPAVVSAVKALEEGNADPMGELLTGATETTVNASAPDTGSMAGWPIQCTDNAPSNGTSIPEVADLVLDISLRERTPWLNADLSTLSFCRNFPNTRPRVRNLGASSLESFQTNAILTARNTSVLIANGLHDPTTPVTSAQALHRWLPTSSQLVTRKGPGHTTISLASLGLVRSIREYLLNGTVAESVQVHDFNQVVFSEGISAETITPEPVFNGTYNEEERRLLEATHRVYLAFISLP